MLARRSRRVLVLAALLAVPIALVATGMVEIRLRTDDPWAGLGGGSLDPVVVDVTVWSDALASIAGAVARVRADGGELDAALVTDAHGRAARVTSREREELELVLAETARPDGIALGRAVRLEVPRFPRDDDAVTPRSLRLDVLRTQTVAVPVDVAATADAETVVHAEPRTHLWSIHVPPGAAYHFRAHVAPLVSGSDVAETLGYYGVEVRDDATFAGMALATDGVSLGARKGGAPSGFVVRLRCGAFVPERVNALRIDAHHVAPVGEPRASLDALEVSLLGYDAPFAHVHVAGELPAGWLFLTVRERGSFGADVALHAAARDGSRAATATAGTTHPAPAPEDDGALDAPSGPPDWPAAPLVDAPWTEASPVARRLDVFPVGPRTTGKPGERSAVAEAVDRLVRASGPVVIDGWPRRVTHEWSQSWREHGELATYSHTFQPGDHGVGQALQRFDAVGVAECVIATDDVGTYSTADGPRWTPDGATRTARVMVRTCERIVCHETGPLVP